MVSQANGFTAVQTYNYDSLNRLKDATENITPHGGSQTQSWKQTYQFDRYGNRRFDFTNGGTTMPELNCTEAICNPTSSTTNNRLSSTGWSYDLSGNTTGDPQGRTFLYDGENKQVSVSDANGTIGEYFYDGDGKRVKKYVPAAGENPGETTVFVYDAAGKLIEEYSTIVASEQEAKVAYLTNDHLGSPRINTDANGAVTARHDYHPFGEEITSPQRHADLGYIDDTVRKQFTGYERDNETELDFAQARMYSKNHGRFTSPDPYSINLERQYSSSRTKSEDKRKRYIEEPRHWNCYNYVLNNPLKYNDPTGYLEYEATLLGQKIKINISDDLSSDEQKRIKKQIDAGIALINEGASKISEADQKIIRNISGINIVRVGENGIQRSGINLASGLFTITANDLDDSYGEKLDNQWAASIIIHDSFHPDQYQRKLKFGTGEDGAEREREANAFAARITKSLGFDTFITGVLEAASKDPGDRYKEPFKKEPIPSQPCARP